MLVLALDLTIVPSVPTEVRDTPFRDLPSEIMPLRLMLSSNLATLPEELLRDPRQPAETGFLDRHRHLIHFIPCSAHLPHLRVLLLIASPPQIAEGRRVDVESELAIVESATHPFREAGLFHLLIEDVVTPRRMYQVLASSPRAPVHWPWWLGLCSCETATSRHHTTDITSVAGALLGTDIPVVLANRCG